MKDILEKKNLRNNNLPLSRKLGDITGTTGDDNLVATNVADNFDGSAGADAVDYSSSSAGVNVDLSTGTGTGGDAEGDTYANIENVIGSAHNDVLTGNDASSSGSSETQIMSGGTSTVVRPNIERLSNGNYAFVHGRYNADTFNDVYVQILDANLVPVNSAVKVHEDTGANNEYVAYDPLTSLTNGNFIVAWQTDVENSVRAQIYDQNAAKVGSQIVIGSDYGTGLKKEPGLARLKNGGFVMVWAQELVDADSTAVVGQIFDNDGVSIGDEFQININFPGNQEDTVVDSLASGGFVVGWVDSSLDGSGTGPAASIWNSDGTRVTNDIQINTKTDSTQSGTAVAGLANGDFMAVFHSNVGDSNSYGIAGRAFTSTGTAITPNEFVVNSQENSAQLYPSIMALDSGGFVAAWESRSQPQDPSGYGPFARIFDSSYNPIGGDFAMHTMTGGDQRKPKFAKAANGGFAAVWTSSSPSNTIFGRLFNADGTVAGGATGENVLTGGAGDDTLIGKGGADTLDGGTGTDTVDYSSSSAAVTVNLSTGAGTGGDAEGDTISNVENVVGSAHADTLTGDANANTLTGGAGDDTLDGRGGADTLDGGAGIDTVSYSSTSEPVTVNLSTGVGTGGDAEGDTYSNIENIVGSSNADTLTGDANANTLTGGTGDDTLVGKGGADTLDGGAGADTIDYSDSSAAVTIDLSASSASGGDAEGDTISNIENVTGSDHGDTLTGDANANTLTGGAGDDTLTGKGGADTLDGGAGSDTLNYADSSSAVTVDLSASFANGGSAEGDTISNVENVTGSDHADELTGDANANTLTGGAGDDTLTGKGGADTLDGGAGSDTIDYSDSSAAVIIDLSASSASGGDAEGDAISNVENVVGSANADTLTGDANANTLTGGAGDDTLTGKGGADTLDGGAGSDTINYSDSSAAVNVNLSTGVGVGGDAEGDAISNVENVTGSDHGDTLTGNASANTLTGGAGADTLDGGAGSDTINYSDSSAAVTVDLSASFANGGSAEGDTISNVENVTGSAHADTLTGDANANTLTGDAGDDTLTGKGGADTLDGGAGSDTVSYADSSSAVTVDLSASFANGGSAEGDMISNIENVTGSDHADTLTGDANANTLTGGAGADTLTGKGGADTLDGGAGSDTIDYSGSSAAVNVNLSTGAGTGGDAEGDIISNIENVTGSDHGDTLTGDASANTLTGGAGDDTLTGKGGADTLDGGAGSDTIDFSGSAAAVNVNLSTGAGTGGDAEGDAISNVENVTGSDHDDELTGDANANTLTGGAGDDTLTGKGGADTLDGGAGDDTLSYADSSSAVTVDLSVNFANGGSAEGDIISNIENVTGSAHADDLTGDANANTLTGGAGDDTLSGKGGADTLDGGAGADTADFSDSSAAVNVNLSTGAGTGGDAEGDTISNVENVTGSAHADTLTGDANANTLTGGAGDDTLTGKGGADTLDGGAGSDTLSYADSSSAVTVDLSANFANGGSAEGDIISNIENVTGSAHADDLTGDANANTLTGGAGADTLTGKGGADTLDGGAGSDTIDYSSSSAAVTVDLSASSASGGDAEGDTLSNIENVMGSANADTLTGDVNANVLTGGAGDDTLAGKGGADTLNGGAGSDTIDYSGSSAAVNVNLSTGSGTGGDAEGDIISNVEKVIGSAHNDTLTGGPGDNVLVGKAGADILDGGAGTDIADYSSSPAAVNVNLFVGSGTGGDAEGDTYVNMEKVIGSEFDDVLSGNILRGGAGSDIFKIPSSAGSTTIEDFEFDNPDEKIDLGSWAEVNGFSDLQLSTNSTDVKIGTAGTHEIIIQNMTVSEIVGNNFMFTPANEVEEPSEDSDSLGLAIAAGILGVAAGVVGAVYYNGHSSADGGDFV